MQNNTIRIIWNLISAQVLGSINLGSGKKNKAILYLPFCAKKRFQTQCNCSNCLLTSRPLKNTHHLSGKKQQTYVDVSENSGTPKSSILIGFSMIFTIHSGVFPPIFGNTHMWLKEGQDVLSVFLLVVCNFFLLKVSSQLLKQRIERSAGVAGKKKLAAGRQNSQYSDLQNH